MYVEGTGKAASARRPAGSGASKTAARLVLHRRLRACPSPHGAAALPWGTCVSHARHTRLPCAPYVTYSVSGGASGASTALADTPSGESGNNSTSAFVTSSTSSTNGTSGSIQAAAHSPNTTAHPPTVALQPVTFTQTHVLPPQPSWQQAAAALRTAVASVLPRLSALSSGVVRWEVPLPRGCSAARWLRGQDASAHHQVYFAGRHSTAPETPKSALAEQSARGWSAVAGLGAAWLWRGAPGVPFGERQLTGVQRMLSEVQPRIRVLGGTRWESDHCDRLAS